MGGHSLLERETRALDGLIAAARAGEGRLVMVQGPAGAGKTALVRLACDAARAAGLGVLAARGDAREPARRYGVVRQWREPEPRPERASRFLAEIARGGPVLLAVDDAQWADVESLVAINDLQPRLRGLGMAVLVAARDGDRGPARAVLDEIRAEPDVRVVAPAPLGERGVAALLERAFDSRVGGAFARACHYATGGNPRYILELQRALAHDGVAPRDEEECRVANVTPVALEHYLHAQLVAVSPDAPRLAGALSIVGEGGSLRLAARVAGMSEGTAAEIARSLVRAAILQNDDPVRFAQPIVRRVIAAQMTCVEREDGHLAAARLLLAARASPETVAAHLLHTRPDARDWCVAALRRAARDARSPEAASAYLRRAADEPPTPSLQMPVLRELGAAEHLTDDPRAVEHLERALRAARDVRTRAETALELARTLVDLARSVEACQILRAALGDLDPGERELRGRLEAVLASSAFLDAATIDAGARLLAERGANPPPGAAGRAIRERQARAMMFTAQPATRVRAKIEAALADADEDDLGGTFEHGLALMIATDGFERAAELIDRYAALAAVRATRRRAAALESIRGWLAACLGSLGDAERHLRASLELTPLGTAAGGVLGIRGLLADVLRLQGRIDEAERTLADGPPEPWPVHVGTSFAVATRARLRFDQGRMQAGLEDLAGLAARESAWGPGGPGLTHWRADAAVALVAVGRRAEAQALIGEELERARAHGAPRALAITLRAAGVAKGGPEGVELLTEALTVLRDSPAVLERARALVELGAALRRANQRRAAREHLDSGLRLAQRCGARPLARRAYDELSASGRRLRRSDLEDPYTLTPAERRVARYAAEGMSNRVIAQSLYLSVKTVEMHLGRTYRKLGITARGELADALSGERPGLNPVASH